MRTRQRNEQEEDASNRFWRTNRRPGESRVKTYDSLLSGSLSLSSFSFFFSPRCWIWRESKHSEIGRAADRPGERRKSKANRRNGGRREQTGGCTGSLENENDRLAKYVINVRFAIKKKYKQVVQLNITIEAVSPEYSKETYTSVQYRSQRATKYKDLGNRARSRFETF